MIKKSVATKRAPSAVGPYSQGIITESFLFLSGQIGVNPESGKMVEGGVESQTRQIFKNIENVLEEAGSSISRVVKATVFLTDMNDFSTVNKIYAENFTEPFPARSAIEVSALPLNALIEIEVIAKI